MYIANTLLLYWCVLYIITRDTYTQCRPHARAFSRCGLVCMEVAVITEPQKGQLDTPYAEQNPSHNIIYKSKYLEL